MKKLALCLLLFFTPYTHAADSCFPEPVKPGVFLGDPGGRSKRLVHVLEVDGCWLKAENCRQDDQGGMACREDEEFWIHVNRLEPFGIKRDSQ